MTPEMLYKMGYEDGKNGKAGNVSFVFDENYSMGYEDGRGDRAAERPVEFDYSAHNAPPPGFTFEGKKRVPKAFEWYLSKMGNPPFLKRERKNNQTRLILVPTGECVCSNPDAKVCGEHPPK